MIVKIVGPFAVSHPPFFSEIRAEGHISLFLNDGISQTTTEDTENPGVQIAHGCACGQTRKATIFNSSLVLSDCASGRSRIQAAAAFFASSSAIVEAPLTSPSPLCKDCH